MYPLVSSDPEARNADHPTTGNSMLRERFDSAVTLDQFTEQAKANQELWRAIRKRAQAPVDLVERLSTGDTSRDCRRRRGVYSRRSLIETGLSRLMSPLM